MGVLRTTTALIGYSSLAAASTFVALTRKNRIVPVPPTDYIFNTTSYARNNPNNSPVTQDICLRKVPLDQLKPELLEKEGKLVEGFVQGLWSGVGFAYQRRFLEKKWRGPETKHQLWDNADLKSSTYEVGTQITDHFEVVSKNADSIVVRCGDSPRIVGTRASDGLFEMLVDIKKEEGFAEFGLKSVFYNGLGEHDPTGTKGGPMPWHVQWLHAQYDKVLMESALRNVFK